MREAMGFLFIIILFVGFPLFVVGSLLWAYISGKRHERETKITDAAHIMHADRNPTQAIGQTQEESIDKSAKGQLKDSGMMKELIKARGPIDAEVLKMVQTGATLDDIKSRWGKEVADRAQEIVDKARAELFAKIEPMVKSGMTREQIIERLRSHTAISPTISMGLGVEMDLMPASLQEKQPLAAQTDKPTRNRSARISNGATHQSIPDPSPAPEGARKRKTNYAVVRSVRLRKAAIAIHGRKCCVCGFSFDAAFGEELAQGYIEIHHLNKIAAGVRHTDPATDLAPLCSNCHAMADRLTRHHTSPPRTIDELRNLLSH